MSNSHPKGARTFYFPLDRGPAEPPETTIVVGQEENGYRISYSVCSKRDSFERKKGRSIAYSRFHEKYGFFGVSILPGVGWLLNKFHLLNENHPNTISEKTMKDIHKLPDLFKKRIERIDALVD